MSSRRDPFGAGQVAAALIVIFLILMVVHFALRARDANAADPAAPAWVKVDCNEYANFARLIAVMRQVEGKLPLIETRIRATIGERGDVTVQAFLREARLVYMEGLEPPEAQFQAFRRCEQVLGRFGPEV